MFSRINNIISNQKRRVVILGVSVIIVFGAIIILSDYGLLNRFKLEYRRITLNKEIEKQRKTGDSLRREIELLRNDPAAIERVAREKYGMKKKNEEVYYIPREEKEK